MRNPWSLFVLLLLIPVAGCGSLDKQYVEADRASFTAARPYHAEYARDHPEKAEGLARIDRSRDARITAAERSLGLTTQPSN